MLCDQACERSENVLLAYWATLYPIMKKTHEMYKNDSALPTQYSMRPKLTHQHFGIAFNMVWE